MTERHKEEFPARVGKRVVHKHGDEVIDQRWWSTADEEQMKDAILLLMETDVGFAVRICGPAFNGGTLDHDCTLEIYRTGYGVGGYGPKDQWIVSYEGEPCAEPFDNPEKAADFFFKVRHDKELGQDMAELKFSGHGTAGGGAPEPVTLPESLPLARGQWVFLDGAVGVVIALEGDEGVPTGGIGTMVGVWFGNQNRIDVVWASRCKPIKKPAFHAACFTGTYEELFGAKK